ncbi:MAG: hypothetical protein ACI867_000749 [Glaciecola sp.]
MKARYRNQLTPEDVGRRVSIRRWVEDPERGARPSDVLGHLRRWQDDVLVVERKDGELVEVYEADILAAKVIPPAPVRPERPPPPPHAT